VSQVCLAWYLSDLQAKPVPLPVVPDNGFADMAAAVRAGFPRLLMQVKIPVRHL
jgi:hypothetical protein